MARTGRWRVRGRRVRGGRGGSVGGGRLCAPDSRGGIRGRRDRTRRWSGSGPRSPAGRRGGSPGSLGDLGHRTAGDQTPAGTGTHRRAARTGCGGRAARGDLVIGGSGPRLLSRGSRLGRLRLRLRRHLASQPLGVGLAADAIGLRVLDRGGVALHPDTQGYAEVQRLFVGEPELTGELVDPDLLRHQLLGSFFLSAFYVLAGLSIWWGLFVGVVRTPILAHMLHSFTGLIYRAPLPAACPGFVLASLLTFLTSLWLVRRPAFAPADRRVLSRASLRLSTSPRSLLISATKAWTAPVRRASP